MCIAGLNFRAGYATDALVTMPKLDHDSSPFTKLQGFFCNKPVAS